MDRKFEKILKLFYYKQKKLNYDISDDMEKLDEEAYY